MISVSKGLPRSTLNFDMGEHGAAFRRSCDLKGVTPSAELRFLIEKSLAQNPSSSKPVFRAKVELDEKRIRREVRFSETELVAAHRLADFLGTTLQGLLISFVRSAAVTESLFSEKELLALGNSSSQLGAIGRNLNQLVRKLNSDFNVLPVDYSNAIGAIESIRHEIKAQIRANSEVMVAGYERWKLIADAK
jgi:hypothetical protein